VIVLMLFGVALAVAVGEIALRAFGFEFATFPVVQFGWPEPVEIKNVFVPDRDLFWVTKDYAAKLAEMRRTAPAVVFLGDSCTEFADWPERTLQAVAGRDPALAHGGKLAVAGWSTEQGLRQLRRDVLPLHPRIVTIYYGWNDHWIAFGKPDAEVQTSTVSFWLAEHLRVVQLFVKLRMSPSRAVQDEGSYRVPRDRYRANLEEMIRLLRSAGTRAIVITAPSAHERGREPAYLARRHLRHLEDLVPLHASYVQATREAIAAAGGELCDAAAKFATLEPPIRRYFSRDGIHVSDRGSRALAEIVTSCLVGQP
jgi:lysophospholipase L1-like esterase